MARELKRASFASVPELQKKRDPSRVRRQSSPASKMFGSLVKVVRHVDEAGDLFGHGGT